MYRLLLSRIVCGFSLLVAASLALGQSGRVRGIVIDGSDQKPLPYTNIWLEWSGIGAVTDTTGQFILMNVPAGEYTLHAQFMGYQRKTIRNVLVTPDVTTTLLLPLEKTVLQGEEVVVTAKDELIQLTATGDRKVFKSDYLSELPVEDVSTLIGAQSGAVFYDDALHVRGGRSDELGVYLDGVLLNNPYDRNFESTLLLSGLEQVSYQPGGVGAQYGGFNSGVVHLTSQKGGSELAGEVDMLTDQWLSEREKTFGAYSYGYSRAVTALHGPVPFTQKHLRFFASLDYLYTKDRSPSWASGIQSDQFVADIDSLIRLQPAPQALVGPKQGNQRKWWGGLFNITGNYKSFFGKIGGSYHFKRDHVYQHARSAFNWQNMPLDDQTDFSLFGHFHWVITPALFLAFDANTYRYQSILQDPSIRDDFINWSNPDVIPNISTWGEIVPILDEFANFQGYGRVFGNYSKDQSERNTLKLHGSWQVTPQHHLEGGVEWQKQVIRFYSITYGIASALHRLYASTEPEGREPTADEIAVVYSQYANYAGFDATGRDAVNSGDFGPRRPENVSWYVQENYETPHFVCQLGVRFDYLSMHQKQLIDPYHIPINETGGVDVSALRDGATYFETNPRIGMAFPVTDRSTLHFHYGKYSQAPPYANTYINWLTISENLQAGATPFLSNPSLKPVKTTSYEIGCDWIAGASVVLDATCFYKEIRDQIQMRAMTGASPMTYLTFVNGDYGTSKGLTFDLSLKRTYHIATQCSYTLMWSEGTGSDPYSQFSLAMNQADDYPTLVSPLSYDQRHALHVSLDFKTSGQEGPTCRGFYPFANLGVMVWYTYGSGYPYTPVEVSNSVFSGSSDVPTGAINVNRMLSQSLCHVRIERNLQRGHLTCIPYVSILNLFNTKTIKRVFESTGMPDDDGWLATPEGQTWQKNYPAMVAWYRAMLADPTRYGMPRQIRLGCKIQF